MRVMSYMSSKCTYSESGPTIKDDEESASAREERSGERKDVPASSSQQLSTYSTISSRSSASFRPMISKAVSPQ